MTTDSTICALSSPAGQGAIALIRLSGTDAFRLTGRILDPQGKKERLADKAPNTIHLGRIMEGDELVDEVLIAVFRAPNSYTGEDVVEISCHGSSLIQQKILELLIREGAVLAKPGEFTQRAFLNGKMDLSQAEAVADLIAAGSAAAHRLAIKQMRGGFSEEIRNLRDKLLKFISLIELELDFSEEDVEFVDRKELKELIAGISTLIRGLIASFEYGNAMKNGVPVAIIGPTNSGKSTLLNRLLHDEKAIVSEIAGTTRDFIEDTIHLGGILFRFIDTAGLRQTSDSIETEGIQRSMKKYEQASVVIIMVDPSESLEDIEQSLGFLRDKNPESRNKTLILALNKSDLLSEAEIRTRLKAISGNWKHIPHTLAISALEGTGIPELEELLVKQANQGHSSEQEVVVTNVRHLEALQHAGEALTRASEGLETNLPSDLLAQDIREALHYLGEITGEITTDEILGNIFRNFCIGK